jgi:hypothetical protein
MTSSDVPDIESDITRRPEGAAAHVPGPSPLATDNRNRERRVGGETGGMDRP